MGIEIFKIQDFEIPYFDKNLFSQDLIFSQISEFYMESRCTEITHLSRPLFDFSKTPDSCVSDKVLSIKHIFQKYFGARLKCVTPVAYSSCFSVMCDDLECV